MTPRQLKFVREYLRDQNATQAMIRAGYSARTANKHCARLLTHPEIRRLIDASLADQVAAVRVEATEVLTARLNEARKEILSARDEIIAVSRRIKKASATVSDIQRLSATTPMPRPQRRQIAPAPSAGPELPAPLMPRPEPRVFGDWTAPASLEGVTFTEGGRSDFEANPYAAHSSGLIAARN